MNSTNGSSNMLYLSEYFLFRMGSTWVLDSLYLYLIPLFGIFSLLLNLFNLFVLFKIDKNQVIYKYFKIYTINGLVVCSILLFSFYPRAFRYFGLASSGLIPSIYRCKIANFCYSLSLFSSCINISILIERISYFQTKYDRFLKIFSQRPYSVSLFCLIFSFCINIPLLFVFQIHRVRF